jgi:hypothetical protein
VQKLLRFAALFCLITLPARAATFSDWVGIIVAGDNHAHSGAPSEVFDNARRDLATAFIKLGIPAENIREFSVQPEKYPNEKLLPSVPQAIADELFALTQKASGGCLIYFTSHGAPTGILVGQGILAPAVLSKIINDTCNKRPSVIVLSACYSGVFLLDVKGDNRIVLTAARRDRPSFGCGESNHYTFFDGCFLQSLPTSGDFQKLGDATRACVAEQEQKLGVDSPSEPQFNVGFDVMANLPTWTPSTAAAEGRR